MADGDPQALTIDQLAAEVGMTVRNVRSHASRGLLPAPEMRGRTAYYSRDHVARLRLVSDLQAQGFNLAAIESMVRATPADSAEQVLDFHRTLLTPWLEEEPVELTYAQLGAAIGAPVDVELITRLASSGLLDPLDGQRVRVTNPPLLRAGLGVIRLGASAAAVVEIEPVIREHARAVADAFVQLFLDTVLPDTATRARSGGSAAGLPPDRLAGVAAMVGQFRPLAAAALLAAFQQQMSEAISSEVGADLQQRFGADQSRESSA